MPDPALYGRLDGGRRAPARPASRRVRPRIPAQSAV